MQMHEVGVIQVRGIKKNSLKLNVVTKLSKGGQGNLQLEHANG